MFRLQKQILDIRYHDEENARPFQDRLRHVYYGKIVSEMESVLKKHDADQSIFRINSLEVDLGEVFEEEFDSEWPRRFRERFEDELVKRLQLIRSEKGSAHDAQIPIRKKQAEIFEYYLLHGVLPWNADGKSNPSLMAEELLNHHVDDLIRVLRKHGGREKVIRRLVVQLTEKQIIRIIEAVQPTEAKFIVETVEKVDLTRKKEAFVKTDSVHFRSKLWEFVLGYILEDRGSYFNTKEFVKSTLFGMAEHFNIERNQLIIQFYRAVTRIEKEISLSMTLRRILTEIYEETTEGAETPEPEPAAGDPYGFEAVRRRTLPKGQTAYRPLTEESIQHLLEQLLFNPAYSEVIKQWLYEQADDSAFRRKISDSIRTFRQFEKLVRLIDGTHADYVVDFSKRLQENQEKERIFPATAVRFQKDKYYFVLTVLHINRGSYFTNKSFVKQVLQQLAAHYGVAYHALLATLLRAVPAQMHGLARLPEILQLLNDLEREETQTREAAEDAPGAVTPQRLMETVVLWAKRGAPPADIPAKHRTFESLWTELLEIRHIDTIWLERFFADPDHIRFLSEILSETLFEATLERFLPAETLRRVKAFHAVGAHIFPYAGQTGVDIRTFRRKQRELVFMRLYTLHKGETTAETFVGEAAVYLSGILRMAVPEFLRESIAAVRAVAPSEKNLETVLEKLEIRHRSEQGGITGLGTGAEAAVREFLAEWGTAPRISDAFQKALAATLKKLKTAGVADVAPFLQQVFTRHTFLDFIQKQANPVLLDILKAYPLRESAHFLTHLMRDIEFLLQRGDIRIQRAEEHLVRAVVYVWFAGGRKEREYAEQMFRFLADSRQMPVKPFKAALKETALALQPDLDSKVILHLATEAGSEKPEVPPAAPPAPRGPGIPYTTEKEEAPLDSMMVDNAGIVLLWPFMTTFFSRLQLTKDGVFTDDAARERGVHLLQYLAVKHTDTPEYGLALPKILCGMLPGDPVCESITVTEAEITLSESLLNGIIQQWSVLKNTSASAFRETFLSRAGMLYRREDRWELNVEEKTFDMLLDQRPWGIQIIKLPWMKDTLFTKWR